MKITSILRYINSLPHQRHELPAHGTHQFSSTYNGIESIRPKNVVTWSGHNGYFSHEMTIMYELTQFRGRSDQSTK